MTQDVDYLIRSARFAKVVSTRFGPMNRFDLVLEAADGQQYECELLQRPETAPPAEGDIIRGRLEQGNYGYRFRKASQQQVPAQAPAAPPVPQPAPAPAPVQQGPSPAYQQAQARAQARQDDLEAKRARRWAISAAIDYLGQQAKCGLIQRFDLGDVFRVADQLQREEVQAQAPAQPEAPAQPQPEQQAEADPMAAMVPATDEDA